MKVSKKIIVIFYLLAVQIQVSTARYYCSLSKVSTETIYYNYTSKNFTDLIDVDGEGEIQSFEAKRCPCDVSFYCIILNEEDMCSSNRGYWFFEREETYCFRGVSKLEYILNTLWLPSVCLLAIVFVMPFASVLGRNASEYVINPCFPYVRRKRIDRMIQNEVNSISNQVAQEASFGRDDGMVEQTILKLKTKSIISTTDDQSADANMENVCLICMVALDEGEKIGDLSCGHSYHVDCLKEWLKRKNACPLCNTQVANPQTVLVDREEFFANDDGQIDEEARSRFNRLLNYYNRRTTRRIHATIN